MSKWKKLQRSDSLRRELVANVSHDLKTPLATLRGYMETLLLKEEDLAETERREYLTIAIKHCVRLNRLVNELFELAKLDSEETRLNPEDFNIDELIYDIAQKFSLNAKDKNISINIRASNDSASVVSADIALIERALENLIENAVHYTDINGTISITVEKQNNFAEISVNNTGKAIPEKDLPQLFDRFYQSPDRSKESRGHSGLGLAYYKKDNRSPLQ